MAQKNFYDLLRPIPTYTEGPQIFKKIVIALLVVVLVELDVATGLGNWTWQLKSTQKEPICYCPMNYHFVM